MLLVLQAFVLQFLLPLQLLYWLCYPGVSRTVLLLRFLCVVALCLLIRHATLWLLLPYTLCYVYVFLAAVILALRLRKVKSPEGELLMGQKLQVFVVLVMLVGLGGLDAWMLGARRPLGEVVDLAFPLGDGSYLVANGGSLPALNAHHATLAPEPEFDSWRGQSYGVDLVAMDSFGLVSSGFLSDLPEDHVIFGREVRAPCAGTALSVVNNQEDQAVGVRNEDNKEGNHVLIDCGGVEVLLAHLEGGSVTVMPGQMLEAGMPIGRVGNTGNTDLPHLHIHAQRRVSPGAVSAGEPLEIRLGGRYLIRGDVVKLPPG